MVAELDQLRDHYLLELLQMGIRPWETDLLQLRDLTRLCGAADQMRRRPSDG